jgi:hypothetical protein
MKRDATSYGIEEREMNNQTANEAVRNGTEQFSFLFENNPQIRNGLSWFNGPIESWDRASVGMPSKKHRMEHIDAWALQRDVNYAYSDRARLFDMGLDSRFEESYVARVRYGCSSTPA